MYNWQIIMYILRLWLSYHIRNVSRWAWRATFCYERGLIFRRFIFALC